MDVLIRINNQTAGRDKIARLLQYLSRLLWHRFHRNNKGFVNGLKNLEFQLSTFRRLLRLGKCIDVLYSTLPLLQHQEPAVRATVIISKICMSLFLLADHILWLGRADVCSVNTDKWSKVANKYWLYSITTNLARDFYEIFSIIKANKQQIVPKSGIKDINDICQTVFSSYILLNRHRNVLFDTLKNGCDFFIPLTALGHIDLSAGTVGLLGVVSSVVGLLVLIDPVLKLTPS